MKNSIFIIISIVIILLAAVGFIYGPKFINSQNISQPTQTINSLPENKTPETSPIINNPVLLKPPINKSLERVTKKPFGIKVTPDNSPISPERFSGYHTGVDFEILPGEENNDVLIFAVCNGTLLLKKQVQGYGGVAVEQCQLENQEVTIIYGHLKLSSIEIKNGEKISAGKKIGILGRGYSSETDGERKHLHLGIHKGTEINLSGYVQNPNDLNNWLDVLKYLK